RDVSSGRSEGAAGAGGGAGGSSGGDGQGQSGQVTKHMGCASCEVWTQTDASAGSTYRQRLTPFVARFGPYLASRGSPSDDPTDTRPSTFTQSRVVAR